MRHKNKKVEKLLIKPAQMLSHVKLASKETSRPLSSIAKKLYY
jgi:hypothetical protein